MVSATELKPKHLSFNGEKTEDADTTEAPSSVRSKCALGAADTEATAEATEPTEAEAPAQASEAAEAQPQGGHDMAMAMNLELMTDG